MIRHRASSLVGGALLALAGLACRSHPSTEGGWHGWGRWQSAGWWSVPSDDLGDLCADVGDLRVCWDTGAKPRVVARPLPPFSSPTPLGFRCVGRGAARSCEPRDRAAGLFVCNASDCVQAHPRQPDDGEWTCADFSGVAVCIGGQRAAGVAEADAASEWICGLHPDGNRVCVDLSPDFPDGRATGLRCRWSYEQGVRRVCTHDPAARVIGDSCDAAGPTDPTRACVDGAACVASRCVPPHPAPSCWLDADCTGRRCRFGTCTASP